MNAAIIVKRGTVKTRNFRWDLIGILCLAPFVMSSEFPERECCDLTTTTTVGPIPIPPAMPTAKSSPTSSPQAIPTGRSGSNIKTAIAILNCILARQLCFEDPSCSAILEIIPRVCGPIPVACSTVTVTKCQAALRTLQAFPFFRPTCLCKEPGVDPECNNFRDFLFDHPCGFVLKKEKDPFPVDALPTCNHALSVCQHERICNKVYEDFKAHCKVRDSKCRMDDRDACHESWASLRMSPMFGCICPNNHMKRRCDRIFSIVNHNPCIDSIPKHFPKSYGIPTNSLHPRPNKFDKVPPRFPHFLFPLHKIPLALASHRPATDVYIYPSSSSNSMKKLKYNVANGNGTNLDEHVFSTFIENNSIYKHNSRNDFILHQHQNFASIPHNKSSDRLHNRRISHQQEDHNSSEIVRKIGMDVNYHESIYDGSMELVQTPLIAPPYTHYFRHRKVILYPYNITAFQASISPTDSVLINYTDKRSAQDVFMDNSSDVQLNFQSTCHIALEACRDDSFCAASLQPMLLHCELHSCNRDACMIALQAFYRGPHEDLSVDIAFCLCRKSSNRHDVCMLAQEKLHPQCAQRPPENFSPSSSNGVTYQPPPACHLVADLCKEDTNCRIKLERFEQACAIDSITKKCAGRTNNCRSALLGILGTQLRMTCACHGIEFTHLYECLGWQRLLWLNPCIVEAQKDFHIKRFAELGVLITKSLSTASSLPSEFKTTNIVSSSVTFENSESYPVVPPSPKSTLPSTKHSGLVDVYSEHDSEEQNSIGRTDSSSEGVVEQIVTTMMTSMMELETVTQISTSSTIVTSKPKIITQNCAVQRPHQADQLVPEGTSRRIYSLDDAECSELCTCGESLTLICHALCVPFAPCRTPLAYYNHASPAYQAFRGRCVCYSGHFICMRPPPGEYYLPGGVFLLLGYSSTDEALLRPHTNLGVQDAVRALQQYILTEIDNRTSCLLTLFNITEENIIVAAKLPPVSKFEPSQLLQEEKEQCASILETISHHINSENSELQAHKLLSIFKMSEVQIVSPEKSISASLSRFSSIVSTYFLSVLPIFSAKFIYITT